MEYYPPKSFATSATPQPTKAESRKQPPPPPSPNLVPKTRLKNKTSPAGTPTVDVKDLKGDS